MPAVFVIRSIMRLFQLPGSVLVETETRWFRLQGETWDSVINRADLSGWVTGQIADAHRD